MDDRRRNRQGALPAPGGGDLLLISGGFLRLPEHSCGSFPTQANYELEV